jgi:hypothetical protein
MAGPQFGQAGEARIGIAMCVATWPHAGTWREAPGRVRPKSHRRVAFDGGKPKGEFERKKTKNRRLPGLPVGREFGLMSA